MLCDFAAPLHNPRQRFVLREKGAPLSVTANLFQRANAPANATWFFVQPTSQFCARWTTVELGIASRAGIARLEFYREPISTSDTMIRLPGRAARAGAGKQLCGNDGGIPWK